MKIFTPNSKQFCPYSEVIHGNTSSNINEVIRSVLNFSFFFVIRSHKYKKAQKEYKALKIIKTQPI